MKWKNIVVMNVLFLWHSNTFSMFSSLLKNFYGSSIKNYVPLHERIKKNQTKSIMHESYFAAVKKKNDRQAQHVFREYIMPLPKNIIRETLEAELNVERLTQEVIPMIENPSLIYAASLMVEQALYKGIELRAFEKLLSMINFSYHQKLFIEHDCIKKLQACLKKNKYELLLQGEIFIDDAHERIRQNEQTLVFIDELEAIIDDDVVAQEYVEIALAGDHAQELSDNDSLNAPSTIEDFVLLENYFE